MENIVNKILNVIARHELGRLILKYLIYFKYRKRGSAINHVKYLRLFRAWEYSIKGDIYLSAGPGWAYDYDFLFKQLKDLSCNQYLPKNGDIVIDVGAGVGEETIIFSNLVGKDGRVFAIEAHPRTYNALTYLVAKNKLSNVVCLNAAFSDRSGTAEINDTDNSLANTILPTGGQKAFTVNAQTFDEFVIENGITKIELVKMNVEGAEQLIVKGMIKSLPLIKNVAISCHDFLNNRGQSEFYKTKDIVISFLRDNGFIVRTQQTNAAMVEDYVYATNPALLAESDDTK